MTECGSESELSRICGAYAALFRAKGAYFGIPRCCVEAVLRAAWPVVERLASTAASSSAGAWASAAPELGAALTPAQRAAAEFGVIPCDAHAQEICAGRTDLWGLCFEARVCPVPFPIDAADNAAVMRDPRVQADLSALFCAASRA